MGSLTTGELCDAVSEKNRAVAANFYGVLFSDAVREKMFGLSLSHGIHSRDWFPPPVNKYTVIPGLSPTYPYTGEISEPGIWISVVCLYR